MFERFSERARLVVVVAQEEARYLGHYKIGTEHILLGVLRDDEDHAGVVLASRGMTAENVRAEIVRVAGKDEETVGGQIPFTTRAKRALEQALRESVSLGDRGIRPEHILLGLLHDPESGSARALRHLGTDLEQIRSETVERLSRAKAERPLHSVPWKQASAGGLKRSLSVAVGAVTAAKEIAIKTRDAETEAELTDVQRSLGRLSARLTGSSFDSGDA